MTDEELPEGGSPELEFTEPEPDAEFPGHDRPRRLLLVLAWILGALLLALLIYLFFFLRTGLFEQGGAVRARIQPVLTIEGPGTGPNPRFRGPMGATFARDGSVYVADSGNDRICVFAPDGHFLFEFGGLGVAKPAPGGRASWIPGRLNYPLGMSTDAEGNLYVADFYNNMVQVFSSTGSPLRHFPDPLRVTGKGGSGIDGHGIAVTDVAVSGSKVYATDTWQIFSFDTSGTLLGQFGKPGRGPTDLDHPNGVAVARDGTVYVADSNHSRVLAFYPDGRLKWSVGRIRQSMSDNKVSTFDLPRGVAVTRSGTVLVIDAFQQRITALSPAGKVIGTFGERGSETGQFNFANGIAVYGDLVVVADKANDRVQVLKLVGLR